MSLEEVSSISRVGDMVSVGLSVDGVVVFDCSRARRFLAKMSAAGTRSGRAAVVRSDIGQYRARCDGLREKEKTLGWGSGRVGETK